MFAAALIIISFGMPPKVVGDMRGPYVTMNECQLRLEEMAASVIQDVPGLMAIGKKCEAVEVDGIVL